MKTELFPAFYKYLHFFQIQQTTKITELYLLKAKLYY